MWLLRAWLDNEITMTDRFARIMFSCANCGNCVTHCAFPEFRDRILLAFTAGKEAILDTGKVPPKIRDYLTRMQNYGNPYAKSPKKRAEWANDLDIEPYTNQEYLFFAGDVGSYDPRGQEIARSVARLLKKAGISFGILTHDETSDGNDVKAMGESELFKELALKNIEVFNKKNIQKIITLSPHSFNAFKKDYPALEKTGTLKTCFQVFHYTQILSFCMGNLSLSKNAKPITVTVHDPCYLGRHNMDYVSIRTILTAIPDVKIAEMDRNQKNSLCCGGGGGNFFTDILSEGEERSARVRVQEAAKTGAKVIVTACPLCTIMLEDAVKVEGLENSLLVKEISEIIDF
jgi:Fe-S oxidoreductase